MWIIPVARFVAKRGLLKAVPLVLPVAVRGGKWVANREKAIGHARKIGGRFGEVWVDDKHYFVVEKDGLIRNHFPRFGGPIERLEAAVRKLDPGELQSPDELPRTKIKRAARRVARRHSDRPPRRKGEIYFEAPTTQAP